MRAVFHHRDGGFHAGIMIVVWRSDRWSPSICYATGRNQVLAQGFAELSLTAEALLLMESGIEMGPCARLWRVDGIKRTR